MKNKLKQRKEELEKEIEERKKVIRKNYIKSSWGGMIGIDEYINIRKAELKGIKLGEEEVKEFVEWLGKFMYQLEKANDEVPEDNGKFWRKMQKLREVYGNKINKLKK